MATNFDDAILSSNGFIPTKTDTPSDRRTRIESISEVPNIPNPFVGMLFYVSSEDKYYRVKSLKSKVIGGITVQNAQVNEYVHFETGGSGTSNYSELSNKPSIGGVTLEGNKTLDKLGIASKQEVEGKQDAISQVNVSVDDATGTPSGSASVSGSTLSISLKNIKGKPGETGPANTITIGTVTPSDSTDEASAVMRGEAPNQILDLVLPRGRQGNSGVTGDTSDIVVVNDLNGGESVEGAIKVLAAEQGKVLKKMIDDVELSSSINSEILRIERSTKTLTQDSYVNGYISSSGNIASGDSFRVRKFKIDNYKELSLSIFSINAPVAYKYAFYNSEEVSSENLIVLGPTSPNDLKETIDVPVNAVIIAVTDNSSMSNCYVSGINYTSQSIDELNNKISEGYVYHEAFDETELSEGFYQKSGQNVVIAEHEASNNYKCIKLTIPEDRNILITSNPYGAIVNSVIYTDNNDSYISSEFIGHDKNENRVLASLTIPDNAKYMYLSGYVNNTTQNEEPVLMAYFKKNSDSVDNIRNQRNGIIWNNISKMNLSVNRAIKFIAFVPKEEYKEHEFSINALSCYSNTYSSAFGAKQFDLWIFDKTEGTLTNSQVFAARYINTNISNFDYNFNDIIISEGDRGTLYAIVNWDVLRGYYSKAMKQWGPVYWTDKYNGPTIQKMDAKDPRLSGFINKTKFADINFAVDGDSITAGNQWSYYVSNLLGFKSHINVAVGSATYACRKQTLNDVVYQTQEYDDPDFAGISSGWESTTDPTEIQKRCNNCAKVHVQQYIAKVEDGTYPQPDIFAFSFATNDSYIGTASSALEGKDLPEVNSDKMFTMAGAARWAIQKIAMAFPSCKIYVLSPIQSSDETRNEKNLEKINVLKDICKELSVQFIDMYANCGICGKIETGTGPYLTDGLHPNLAGRKKMAEYAVSCIGNHVKID